MNQNIRCCLLGILLLVQLASAGRSSDGLRILSSSANAGYYYAQIVNEGSEYYETVYGNIISYLSSNVPFDTFTAPLVSYRYGTKGRGLAPNDTGYVAIEYVQKEYFSAFVYGETATNPGDEKRVVPTPLQCSEIMGNLGYYRCKVTNTTSDTFYNAEAVLLFYTDASRDTISGVYPLNIATTLKPLLPGETVDARFDYQPLCIHIDSTVIAFGLPSRITGIRMQHPSVIRSAHLQGITPVIMVNALGKSVDAAKVPSVLFTGKGKMLHMSTKPGCVK